MTARLLLCVALCVGVGVPFARLIVGNPNTLVLLSACLLALGAGLIACDQTCVTYVRHRRVGAVIVSIILLILLASGPFSPWRSADPTGLPALKPATADAAHKGIPSG